jgi:hypothetical protein
MAADTLAADELEQQRAERGLAAVVGWIGLVVILANESARHKVLDALFGAEEEFEYSASTAPEPAYPSETRASVATRPTGDPGDEPPPRPAGA